VCVGGGGGAANRGCGPRAFWGGLWGLGGVCVGAGGAGGGGEILSAEVSGSLVTSWGPPPGLLEPFPADILLSGGTGVRGCGGGVMGGKG
jgi:hypothetical protein